MFESVRNSLKKWFRRTASPNKLRILPTRNSHLLSIGVPEGNENIAASNYFFAVFSYKEGSLDYGLPENVKYLDKYQDPPLTTLGFKKIFWKAFKGVFAIHDIYAEFTWLDSQLAIREVHIFVTTGVLSPLGDSSDCLIAYSIETLNCTKEELLAKMQNFRKESKISDQKLIEMFNTSISKTPYYQLSSFSYIDFPGCSFFMQPYPDGSEIIFPFLYGFHYYNLLLYHRLERDQVDLELNLDINSSNQALQLIANNRIRLINIQRYFLTANRSNIEAIKDASDLLRETFSLPDRYIRHIDINNSLEKHLSNVSRIAEAEKSQIFSLIAALLTFFGVPVAIFSALMSANLDAAIIVKPEKLWSDHKFLIISAVSFIIPLSVVFVGFAIDFVLSVMRNSNKTDD